MAPRRTRPSPPSSGFSAAAGAWLSSAAPAGRTWAPPAAHWPRWAPRAPPPPAPPAPPAPPPGGVPGFQPPLPRAGRGRRLRPTGLAGHFGSPRDLTLCPPEPPTGVAGGFAPFTFGGAPLAPESWGVAQNG